MPLLNSASKSAFSENIKREMAAGRPQKQSLAIAYSVQRRAPHADGGVVDRAVSLAREAARNKSVATKLAMGGTAPEIPYFERQEARALSIADTPHPGGLVNSTGPGRTDIHNADVPAGSYVLPADVVSGLGEGNTWAGGKVIESILNSGPYGVPLPRMRGARGPYSGLPHAPAPFHDPSPLQLPQPRLSARGGGSEKPIPIVIAGGEFVIPPEYVAKLGGGDIKRGLRILDAFVLHVRKNTVKTLKKLPGPVK